MLCLCFAANCWSWAGCCNRVKAATEATMCIYICCCCWPLTMNERFRHLIDMDDQTDRLDNTRPIIIIIYSDSDPYWNKDYWVQLGKGCLGVHQQMAGLFWCGAVPKTKVNYSKPVPHRVFLIRPKQDDCSALNYVTSWSQRAKRIRGRERNKQKGVGQKTTNYRRTSKYNSIFHWSL